MENENAYDLTEQDVIDLYDDIIESPTLVGAALRCYGSLVPMNGYCCTAGTRWGRVGSAYSIISGACQAAY